MTFLPIVGRELRVAARRRWTYWSRSSAALLALVLMAFGFFTWDNLGLGQAMLAQQLFGFLSVLTLLFCLVEGARQTADCLSGEKRDGTLGLLFLTDLRGVDVVFGKFAAASLSSAQGLLAMLPILGLPLLLGGITAGEFWRMVLALLNALFFSLCAGMWVSARSREEARAIFGALGLTALFCLGLPLVEMIVRQNSSSFTWVLSPLGPFNGSGNNTYSFSPFLLYWLPLLVTNGLGWLFLLLAAHRTGRHWREAMDSREAPESRWSRLWRGSRPTRQNRRRAMLADEGNPLHWLAARNQVLPVWWALGVAVVLGVLGWYVGRESLMNLSWFGYAFFSWLIMLGCKILATWAACRLLVEARRNGALELWLCTPVTVKEIVTGAWLAYRKVWFVTFYLALGLALMFGFHLLMFEQALLEELDLTWGGAGAGTVTMGLPDEMRWDWQMFKRGIAGAVAVLDLTALFWVGMWLSLTRRSLAQAMFQTFLWVVFLPGLALGLMQVVHMTGPATVIESGYLEFLAVFIFTPILAFCVWLWYRKQRFRPFLGGLSVLVLLAIAYNLFLAPEWGNRENQWPWFELITTLLIDVMFITWARRNVLNRFREVASLGLPDKASWWKRFTVAKRHATPPPLPTGG
jgi:hypothetical protein